MKILIQPTIDNLRKDLGYDDYEDTDVAPAFPKVWAQIEPLIQGLPLVVHNKPFDEG